jgi:hypothetical protein
MGRATQTRSKAASGGSAGNAAVGGAPKRRTASNDNRHSLFTVSYHAAATIQPDEGELIAVLGLASDLVADILFTP